MDEIATTGRPGADMDTDKLTGFCNECSGAVEMSSPAVVDAAAAALARDERHLPKLATMAALAYIGGRVARASLTLSCASCGQKGRATACQLL